MKVVGHGLYKRYGKRSVLRGLDFELDTGVYGLLGPNGAGKSTLIKILATVLPPSSGSIQIGEHQIPGGAHNVRQHIGYLPQIYGLYEHMTGREFLEYAAAMKGMTTVEARSVSVQILLRVNLQDAAAIRVSRYSGGMRQRLALAQALIGEPQFLILDEPSSGLDPEERMRLKNTISAYGRDATVLLSTHIVEDLENLAQGILVMGSGCILAKGTPAEVRDCALGKVFELRMRPERWATVENEWRFLSPEWRPVVSTVRADEDDVAVRIVTDGTVPDMAGVSVSAAEPTLSDGYLALSDADRSRQAS